MKLIWTAGIQMKWRRDYRSCNRNLSNCKFLLRYFSVLVLSFFPPWFCSCAIHVLYGPQLTSCHFEAISEKLKKVIRKAALLYPKIRTLQSWHFFSRTHWVYYVSSKELFFSVAIIVIIRKAAFTYRNFVEVCLL